MQSAYSLINIVILVEKSIDPYTLKTMVFINDIQQIVCWHKFITSYAEKIMFTPSLTEQT